MSEKNTVIKLDNVSKRFNVYSRNIDRIKGVLLNRDPAEVKYALNNISLNIKKGERVVIFGAVDSGRSTLLKIISEITKPSKGNVYVDGSTNVMMDAKAGMDMELSCIDNIYMKANVVGLKKEEIREKIDEILEFAGVPEFRDLPLKRAPKGTAALLSSAVHFEKQADILICDDVFGGGGQYCITRCESGLEKYLNENMEMTAILVSGRNILAKRIAQKAIVLNKGYIIYEGDVDIAWKKLLEISAERRRKAKGE